MVRRLVFEIGLQMELRKRFVRHLLILLLNARRFYQRLLVQRLLPVVVEIRKFLLFLEIGV